MFNSQNIKSVPAEMITSEGGVTRQLTRMDMLLNELEAAQSRVFERYSRAAVEHPDPSSNSLQAEEAQCMTAHALSQINGRLDQMIKRMHAFAEHCDL